MVFMTFYFRANACPEPTEYRFLGLYAVKPSISREKCLRE
jgi:hypothetical protein